VHPLRGSRRYGGRMSKAAREPDESNLADKDPVEVLRRMLAISPEDAEKVREDAAEKMKADGS
jgi:hypothetical protein